jgi:hypothetical protein
MNPNKWRQSKLTSLFSVFLSNFAITKFIHEKIIFFSDRYFYLDRL